MLHAVIMAGGSGTRFWPESRAARPKQLLRLVGSRSMIQATADRLGELAPAARTLVVTNERLVEAVRQQLPELSAEAVIGEPCKRDTAPCIGLAAVHLLKRDPDATMVVLPSDHVIQPEDEFRRAIDAAARMVDEQPGRIVTFGIRPTYAAESYGYIERGEPLKLPAGVAALAAFRVASFREKPKADVAQQYLASGRHYWNSGIFVWRAATILSELKRREPEMHARLARIGEAIGTVEYPAVFEREFAAIRGKSIDYAVMEHAEDVAMVEAPFEWDDVGSWQAMSRLEGTDDAGNTLLGLHLAIETTNSIVRTDDEHLVALLGVDNLLVIHTPRATLVTTRDREEEVRKVVKLLEERGWSELL